MKPRSCDECKYTNNCNSAFGGAGCRYNIAPVLAMILVLVFGMTTIVSSARAEEQESTKEAVVIDAEDIGIKTIEADQEEIPEAEVEEEAEYEEPEVSHESQEEEPEPEETEPVQEEVESPEPPEGMVEGYEAGVYFEPNCFDCEICEACYKCETCTFENTISYEEDIDTYFLEKTCIVCGHGTSEALTEEELDILEE